MDRSPAGTSDVNNLILEHFEHRVASVHRSNILLVKRSQFSANRRDVDAEFDHRQVDQSAAAFAPSGSYLTGQCFPDATAFRSIINAFPANTQTLGPRA